MNMTILELLKQKLPSEYIIAIIRNLEDKNVLNDESSSSILNDIEEIFDWAISFEGYEFWVEVFESIANGRQLPSLPFKADWFPNTFINTETGCYILNYQGSGRDLLLAHDFSIDRLSTKEEFYIREQNFSFCN